MKVMKASHYHMSWVPITIYMYTQCVVVCVCVCVCICVLSSPVQTIGLQIPDDQHICLHGPSQSCM